MSGIGKATGDNYGGLAKLYYAKMSAVADLFDFEYFKENLTISQANFDSRFSELQFLIRSGEYQFNRADDDTYTIQAQAVFQKSRQDVRDHIDAVRKCAICLIMLTNNEEWLIVPNMYESPEFRSGSEPIHRNGFVLSWTGQFDTLPLPITIE